MHSNICSKSETWNTKHSKWNTTIHMRNTLCEQNKPWIIWWVVFSIDHLMEGNIKYNIFSFDTFPLWVNFQIGEKANGNSSWKTWFFNIQTLNFEAKITTREYWLENNYTFIQKSRNLDKTSLSMPMIERTKGFLLLEILLHLMTYGVIVLQVLPKIESYMSNLVKTMITRWY